MDQDGTAAFGNRLARLMREAGIRSKKEFADKIGISVMTLSRYEKGEREPNSSTIVSMARVLNCSADTLLGLPSQRGIAFPRGTPANDMVECLMPIVTAAQDLVWAMTEGSSVAPARIFPVDEFHEFAGKLLEWPLLQRARLLKIFADKVEREIPHGRMNEMEDLTLGEVRTQTYARDEAFELAVQVQAIYTAVLWAGYGVLEGHDDLFEHPGIADHAEVEELRVMVERYTAERETHRTVKPRA